MGYDSVNLAIKYVIQNLKKILALAQKGKKNFLSWFWLTNDGKLTLLKRYNCLKTKIYF